MTAQPRWWSRLAEWRWAPHTLLAIFTILICFTITRFGSWIDESATLLMVRSSYSKLFEYTTYDAHPPLWYFVLKVWLELFGQSLVAARAESAVFMIATVAIWYRFARTRFSRPTALLALALSVTNPMMIHYAVEGRMYAFGMLLTAITTTLITGRWHRRWIAYWPLAVVMLYVHYFLAFVLAAQFLYLILTRESQERSLRFIILYGASIVLAFLPWIPFALHMTTMVVRNGFWIPPVTPSTIPNYVLHAFLHRIDGHLIGWRVFPAIVYLTVFVSAMIRAGRSKSSPQTALWCLAGVPWLFLLALSAKVAIFHPRYVIFGLPALILLIVLGAQAMRPRWRTFVLAVLLLGHVFAYLALREFGFSDRRRYWAMKPIAAQVSKPIDGELPTVVATWLFTFVDAKVSLSSEQRVVHLRESAKVPGTFPDVMYYDNPDWELTSLDDVHTRHAWILENGDGPNFPVPDNWHLVRSHRRGYARIRLFEITGGAPTTPHL